MADAQLELALRSVPSTWIHPDCPPTPEPYQRIIGVASEIGDVACQFQVDGPITTDRFEVPRSFAWNLTTFFQDYIAPGPDPETAPLAAYAPSRYNCYTFAASMLGKEWYDMGHAINQIRMRALGYAFASGNLALGQHGVVRMDSPPGNITHNIIGLGEDVPACIQVVNNNSNMGIMPYSLVRQVFRSTYLPSYKGGYAITATAKAS